MTDSHSFAEDFANGYLLGEVLQKYALQDDFDQFSQNKYVNLSLAYFRFDLFTTANSLHVTKLNFRTPTDRLVSRLP